MKNDKISYGGVMVAVTGALAAAFVAVSLVTGGSYGDITQSLFEGQPAPVESNTLQPR